MAQSPEKTGKTYQVTISKTDLAALPAAVYEGTVSLIDHEKDIENALAELRKAPVVGFDTETRPTFKKGVSHTVALMQLSTGPVTYLFRLNHLGLHPLLVEFLQDPDVAKIGLSIHDDFHNLKKLCPLEPAGFIDLQQYVKQFMIADNSLTRIHGILFGERISKGQRLTNWEADTLTHAQQIYAALDAQACIRIFNHLQQGKFNPWESPFLQEIVPPENEE